VTPEHVVPQILEAVAAAIPLGLAIPIVYNTSAYDSLRSLQLLDGIVDIYMPDFKFWHSETSKRFAKAPDYPKQARKTVLEMQRQVEPLRFSPQGTARRGLLVRHLLMPGQLAESRSIFRWLAESVSRNTFVNILTQYHPDHEVGQAEPGGGRKYAEINRRPDRNEVAAACQAAREAGLWRFA
jgi:putative pyruvate formate lyase activating enzyme